VKAVLKAYGDGTVFGETYGESAPAVLWLHGWARTSSDFAACGSALATAGHASLALDLPGFGASPAPDEPGGARHYAELLEGVLEQLGPGPLVLVGHSFGGRVALCLGVRRPDLVRALVLTGAPLLRRDHAGHSPLAYRAIRFAHRLGAIGDERMEKARQKYGSADYRASSGVMRQVLVASVNESYETELETWHQPTTMVWGELDHDVPVAIAERAGDMMPQAKLTVLAGVGHLTPTQAPEALVDATLEVLA
jgi:pimeloyl-ACP methyl ester carboxylesterase